jgi:hypothetical protein
MRKSPRRQLEKRASATRELLEVLGQDLRNLYGRPPDLPHKLLTLLMILGDGGTTQIPSRGQSTNQQNREELDPGGTLGTTPRFPLTIGSDVTMTTLSNYRQYGKECIRWATEAKTDNERDTLVEMARAWRRVALVESDVMRQSLFDAFNERKRRLIF